MFDIITVKILQYIYFFNQDKVTKNTMMHKYLIDKQTNKYIRIGSLYFKVQLANNKSLTMTCLNKLLIFCLLIVSTIVCKDVAYAHAEHVLYKH